MSDLSPTMSALVADIKGHGGTITRYPGGFWIVHTETAMKTWSTSTVAALVTRGVLEYCEWKDGRNGRFPVKARIAGK